MVAIAVRDIELGALRIHHHVRRPSELRAAAAAFGLAGAADLHQELALRRELEDLVVLLAVAGDPDIALRIDVDAVLALRPLRLRVARAPAAQVVARGVELDHRRRRLAAAKRDRPALLRGPP